MGAPRVEITVYKTTAIMNAGEPHIEHDFDTHIGFNDGQAGVPGHYAIAEIPDIVQGPGTDMQRVLLRHRAGSSAARRLDRGQ